MPRAVRQSIRNSSAETHENGNFLTIGTKKIGMDNNNPYKQLPFTLFGYFLPVCDLSGCSTSNNLPNNSCEISVKNGSAPSHERFSSNFSLKPFSMYAEQGSYRGMYFFERIKFGIPWPGEFFHWKKRLKLRLPDKSNCWVLQLVGKVFFIQKSPHFKFDFFSIRISFFLKLILFFFLTTPLPNVFGNKSFFTRLRYTKTSGKNYFTGKGTLHPFKSPPPPFNKKTQCLGSVIYPRVGLFFSGWLGGKFSLGADM